MPSSGWGDDLNEIFRLRFLFADIPTAPLLASVGPSLGSTMEKIASSGSVVEAVVIAMDVIPPRKCSTSHHAEADVGVNGFRPPRLLLILDESAVIYIYAYRKD